MMSPLQSLDDTFRSPHNSRAVQSAPTDLSGDASSLLDSLAQFATTLDLELVPSNVRRQAGLCILDTIGCILAGADAPEGAMLFEAESESNGGRVANVIGRSQVLPIEAAARVHGYWGDIFELNDLIGGHASIGNVAAALSLIENCEASGAALLKAVIIGIEVTSRVYASAYPSLKPYTEVAMVTPGLVSAFGSAAVAASLQGMSCDKTREALAIAGTLATWCPAEAIFGSGGTVKPMLFGAWPAAIGVRSVHYANHGMTGPSRLLESRIGLFATLCREFDSSVTADNTRWFLAEPRRKLHACCGYTHSVIDLLIEIRNRLGAAALDQSTIRVAMPAYVIPAISKPKPPASPNEARFHIEYCAALAACGADVILPEHSTDIHIHLTRPEIRAMMANIEVVADPELSHYHQSRIMVLKDGAALHDANCDAPRGSALNPLSDAQVIEKFQRLSKQRLSARASSEYAVRFTQLERETTSKWIFEELCPT